MMAVSSWACICRGNEIFNSPNMKEDVTFFPEVLHDRADMDDGLSHG
jgi:hypothetical protein